MSTTYERVSAAVVDPHVENAEIAVLGEHEELGVEEPFLVLDAVKQRVVGIALRCEATLRVG